MFARSVVILMWGPFWLFPPQLCFFFFFFEFLFFCPLLSSNSNYTFYTKIFSATKMPVRIFCYGKRPGNKQSKICKIFACGNLACTCFHLSVNNARVTGPHLNSPLRFLRIENICVQNNCRRKPPPLVKIVSNQN